DDRLALRIAAAYLPVFDAFLRDLFTTTAKQTCEVELISEDTWPLMLELTGVGVATGLECRIVATDITECKRTEQERTRLQLQLAQAQKLEAIGTLAGGIAHDFNNLLAGILGGLSLLDLELGETGKPHAAILEMQSLVERGADLTKQLLGFARQGKYHVRPLNLAREIQQTSTVFGRVHKHLVIALELAPNLHAVLMDQTQLTQVLLNLLVNAGQAMPEGGRLLIRAEDALPGAQDTPPVAAGFVKLMVADTGSGMDAATQARIFEPFFTTKGPGQGTGLGLASVYGIVKSHGGAIGVESKPGQGTTFTLFLPATDQPVAEEKTPAAIQRGTGTILVVDDETSIVSVFARLLQKMGYSVLTAPGGEQALEIVRQRGKQVSLVILDLNMPGFNGRQTYDALQAIVPGLKVLLASGFSLDHQAQEILARGGNGFLQKPFNAATLSAKLREIL
ncbi:MAG: response regulator, partial [Candidatus Firestonebacteria bacterium]|nr:response regulator [Candidatus Firestonebacteria bacterium]